MSPTLEHSYGMKVAVGDIELRWSFFIRWCVLRCKSKN